MSKVPTISYPEIMRLQGWGRGGWLKDSLLGDGTMLELDKGGICITLMNTEYYSICTFI